jgi:antitoxin (DNA-binding transcriptional repressor) of toxin-antitoxin stability system
MIAEPGEEITTSRAETPVARVVPLTPPVRRTARGSLRGTLVTAADWDSAGVNDPIADDFRSTP